MTEAEAEAVAPWITERNMALESLWRIAGCPPGLISVALCSVAEARVADLQRQLASIGQLARQVREIPGPGSDIADALETTLAGRGR